MMFSPDLYAAESAGAEVGRVRLDGPPDDELLGGDLPIALRARPRYVGSCMNRKCDDFDSAHHRVIGGILGDRYVCDVCLATGGPCR